MTILLNFKSRMRIIYAKPLESNAESPPVPSPCKWQSLRACAESHQNLTGASVARLEEEVVAQETRLMPNSV